MPWVTVEFEEQTYRVPVARTNKGVWVGWPGGSAFLEREEEVAARSGSKEDCVIAPMTGRVLEVKTQVGDVVESDQVLVVLEAMKMEYRLCAPRAGSVEVVGCVVDELVELGVVLVSLEDT